jgi:PiT family inorganic phosphate transporter
MAAGTAAGGWRIIRTLGHRVVKLQPVHGFAAETTAALIIQVASYYGIPLSTTHVISTSIMGVGAVKRFTGIRWTVVERIVWAWVFTLPATALIGYMLERAIGTPLTLNEPARYREQWSHRSISLGHSMKRSAIFATICSRWWA